MSAAQLYDTIGATYTVTRRTEPRIAAQVWAALGDARTVLNVGAGTGSYEPSDRDVTAVEPSAVMRAQRPVGAARCVAASAESLPFEDQSFDAAMAFATVHHWRDPIAGLREMQRVARRVVVFTCETTDQSWRNRFWLTRDYLPEIAASRVGLATELAGAIGTPGWSRCVIPWDCVDGFSRGVLAPARGVPGTRTSVAEFRYGRASGRPPNGGLCATSVTTSSLVAGPNATATSSTSRRQSSGCACSSPEPPARRP